MSLSCKTLTFLHLGFVYKPLVLLFFLFLVVEPNVWLNCKVDVAPPVIRLAHQALKSEWQKRESCGPTSSLEAVEETAAELSGRFTTEQKMFTQMLETGVYYMEGVQDGPVRGGSDWPEWIKLRSEEMFGLQTESRRSRDCLCDINTPFALRRREGHRNDSANLSENETISWW